MIDFDKPLETRDGRKVRIYASDGAGIYPIHGAIFDDDLGGWSFESWEADGKYWDSTEGELWDLVNVKKKYSGWIVIHKAVSGGYYPSSSIYETETICRKFNPTAATVTKIEWEE